MKTLRELYIETGAIVPRRAVREVSLPVLRMDEIGKETALQHMAADAAAASRGELCDMPLEQVPEFVLEAWARRERRHAA